MKKLEGFLIIFFFVFGSTAMAQNDPMKGPWQKPTQKNTRHGEPTQVSITSAFTTKFFRRYISPIDGSDCPMYPSCSQYSIECFEKHGFFMGWAMTWDRLYRCGRDELQLSPWIFLNGQQKCYDPPENNDFWWHVGK
jgi:putative membrane protein insertion efficiency factor